MAEREITGYFALSRSLSHRFSTSEALLAMQMPSSTSLPEVAHDHLFNDFSGVSVKCRTRYGSDLHLKQNDNSLMIAD